MTLVFSDNCIWSGNGNLSLLRRKYTWFGVNVLINFFHCKIAGNAGKIVLDKTNWFIYCLTSWQFTRLLAPAELKYDCYWRYLYKISVVKFEWDTQKFCSDL